MATIKELIRTEAAGGISFGNYELNTKSKLSDFEYNGDLYKVKTFCEITKLERNEVILDGMSLGHMKTNLGGKLSFSVDLNPDKAVQVEIDRL